MTSRVSTTEVTEGYRAALVANKARFLATPEGTAALEMTGRDVGIRGGKAYGGFSVPSVVSLPGAE